jgi:ubiquinone/menaquinone biosynthesis C-methylase UbiE
MGRLARHRLGATHKLARGLAQSLPYAADSFDSVVATFPSEYIFDRQTLSEVKRVLRNRGRLIVLPAAFPSNRFLKWLYRVTGESPVRLDEVMKQRWMRPFVQAGFAVDVEVVELRSSRLVFLLAKKND